MNSKNTTTIKEGDFHKKKKERCFYADCRKKLKLTDMNCKCEHRFCSKHRLPETHKCSWNPKCKSEMIIYKEKAGLVESVVFQKMQRI